jgi:hypothetical protein
VRACGKAQTRVTLQDNAPRKPQENLAALWDWNTIAALLLLLLQA